MRYYYLPEYGQYLKNINPIGFVIGMILACALWAILYSHVTSKEDGYSKLRKLSESFLNIVFAIFILAFSIAFLYVMGLPGLLLFSPIYLFIAIMIVKRYKEKQRIKKLKHMHHHSHEHEHHKN